MRPSNWGNLITPWITRSVLSRNSLPMSCAPPELVRANASDTRFSGFIQKKSKTKHHILPMMINTNKWSTNQIIFICAVDGIKYQNTSKAIIIYHWSSVSLEKISHTIFLIYLNYVKEHWIFYMLTLKWFKRFWESPALIISTFAIYIYLLIKAHILNLSNFFY